MGILLTPSLAFQLCLYVLAHPEIYDVGKISLGGISAGAGLALAVGSKLGPEKISAVSVCKGGTEEKGSGC
jgi:acetyl esterase/lipase